MADTTTLSATPTQPVLVLPRGMTLPLSNGQIGFYADAIVEESHQDRSEITRHPVERGSPTTDNIVRQPSEVVLTYGWGVNSPQNQSQSTTFLRSLYAELLAYKDAAVLFDLYTGKRSYQNMAIELIAEHTDNTTDQCLLLRIALTEVLITTTTTVVIPQDQTHVADPTKTQQQIQKGVQQLKQTTVDLRSNPGSVLKKLRVF